jgi:HK97 family phage portal protein
MTPWRLLRNGRVGGNPPVQRATQSWWNLAGAPGFISSAVYGATGVEQALRNSASWACMDVLADAIGRTPFDVVRGEGATRRPVVPQPSSVSDPSGVVLTDVWRNQLGWSLVTDGNAFGQITSWTPRVYPNTTELLDPSMVMERKVVNGVPQVQIDNEVHQLYPFGDIWHVPGRVVLPGSPFGLSPVAYSANAIGTSLSAEQFSSRFFTDGGHPTAIIYSSSPIDKAQAQDIKHSHRQATSGNREVAVMGADLKYEKIQVDPKDSQFIDLMRFEVEQACRFWRVPPVMVYAAMSGQAVTYANVTEADINFLKHSLDGYFVRVETAMTAILPRPQHVKLNRNAILRADPKSRYEQYSVALANRQTSVNEVRALEDQPPFGPEFDVPGIPPYLMPTPPTAPAPGGAQ